MGLTDLVRQLKTWSRRQRRLAPPQPTIEILEDRSLPAVAFSPPLATATGDGFNQTVAAGDFTGDGRLDLAVTARLNSTEREVRLLVGQGDGTFQSGGTLFHGSDTPGAMVGGDFNRDGKFDLLVAFDAESGAGGDLRLFAGNGNQTFSQPREQSVSQLPRQLLAADVNSDGILDVLALGTSATFFLKGNGDGSFAAATSFATRADSFALGDFNSDGKLDLMFEEPAPEVQILIYPPPDPGLQLQVGDGKGGFAPAQGLRFVLPNQEARTSTLAAGDFNGDGRADLAVATPADYDQARLPGRLRVLPGNPNGSFTLPNSYQILDAKEDRLDQAPRMFAGDVNSDGQLDLVFVGEHSVTTRLNRGDLTFTVTGTSASTAAGEPATFNATVRAPDGAVKPTGTVTVAEFSRPNAQAAARLVTYGRGTLDAAGQATITADKFREPRQEYQLLGIYEGDDRFGVTALTGVRHEVRPTGPLPALLNRLYRDLLKREGDADGIAFFQGQLERGQATRAQVLDALLTSEEFRSQLVRELYQSYLHRDVDQTGLTFWVGFLRQGTREQLETALLSSEEYYQQRGGSTPTGFLDAVYQDLLGRAPQSAERTFWQNTLTQTSSRTAVVAGIRGSAEAQARVVRTLYTRYLGRDVDATGLEFFVTRLRAGVTTHQVLAVLLGSNEYSGRATQDVNQRYLDALGPLLLKRALTSQENRLFLNQLGAGDLSPEQLIQVIRSSQEHATAIITERYQTLLGRAPRQEEILLFTALLRSGQGSERLTLLLASSGEYYQHVGGTADSFVRHLFQDVLRRDVDTAGRVFFLQQLNQGASRDEVVRMILSSDEYRTLVVRGFYDRILKREADAAGLAYWVAALKNGARPEDVEAQFLTTGEVFAA